MNSCFIHTVGRCLITICLFFSCPFASGGTQLFEGTLSATFNTATPSWQGVEQIVGNWSFRCQEPAPEADENVVGTDLDFPTIVVGSTTFDSSNVTAVVNYDPGLTINSVAFQGGEVGNPDADYFTILYSGFTWEIVNMHVNSASVASFQVASNPPNAAGACGGNFSVTTLPEFEVEILGGAVVNPGDPIDFGTVGQGGYRSFMCRIRNTGEVDVPIASVSVSGADQSDFQSIPAFFTIPDPYILAPGAQADCEVRFAPVQFQEGPRAATLSIMLDGGLPPREIPLAGNVQGFAQPQPVFRYRVLGQGDEFMVLGDGDTVDFGAVAVGNGGYIEFVIENSPEADADFPIRSVFNYIGQNGKVRTTEGYTNFPGYTGVVGYNPGSIPPGASFGFTLVFEPYVRGPMSATHVFEIPTGNGILSTFTTNLSGTGLAGELTVVHPDGQEYESGLGFADFGTVAIGAQVGETFTLRNDGDADLFVTGISFVDMGTGSADGLNSYLGLAPETPLGPGEQTTLEFQFWPQWQTSLEGMMAEISSSDPQHPTYRIHIQGRAEPAQQVMNDAFSTSGLSGDDALPDATPFSDGVPNLLKYAFNMNLAGPDSSTLAAGGSSGLPVTSLDESGPEPVLRVEFVRRKGSGLIYTAQHSTGLNAFEPMTGTTTVTDIDGQWERVVVEEPCNPATTPQCFSRVAVEIP